MRARTAAGVVVSQPCVRPLGVTGPGVLLACLLAGCAQLDEPRMSSQRAETLHEAAQDSRRIVRSGELTVSVRDPEAAGRESRHLVERAGGFASSVSSTDDSTVWLRSRVPAAELERVMDAIAALGEVERRSLSAVDVTDEYVDLETRLENDLALRERLRALLERASDVEDVLAIEKELARLQSEIETRQSKLERLKGEVELSALTVALYRKRILGPLGYLSYGIWWSLSKLFVIR